jgi:hypothetical protein
MATEIFLAARGVDIRMEIDEGAKKIISVTSVNSSGVDRTVAISDGIIEKKFLIPDKTSSQINAVDLIVEWLFEDVESPSTKYGYIKVE